MVGHLFLLVCKVKKMPKMVLEKILGKLDLGSYTYEPLYTYLESVPPGEHCLYGHIPSCMDVGKINK